jgi:6-phospho-3-hexuloisomerase
VDGVPAGLARPWAVVADEIGRTLDGLDADRFAAVVEEFQDLSRRWFVTGQGRSGLVGHMFAMRLMHLGRSVHVVGETTAPSVRSGDGLVIVSGSGRTPVSLHFAEIARAEGARVVVLTSQPASPLAQLADLTLVLPSSGSTQLGGSQFEQSALLVLDALVYALAAEVEDAPGVLAHRHTNLQ